MVGGAGGSTLPITSVSEAEMQRVLQRRRWIFISNEK